MAALSTFADGARLSRVSSNNWIADSAGLWIKNGNQANLHRASSLAFTPQPGWGNQTNNGNSTALPDRDLEIETVQDTNAVLQTLVNDLRSAGILQS